MCKNCDLTNKYLIEMLSQANIDTIIYKDNCINLKNENIILQKKRQDLISQKQNLLKKIKITENIVKKMEQNKENGNGNNTIHNNFDSDLFTKDCLYATCELFCRTSFFKNPIKKIKLYKKMNYLYFNLVKFKNKELK